jgi:hypothetical protein
MRQTIITAQVQQEIFRLYVAEDPEGLPWPEFRILIKPVLMAPAGSCNWTAEAPTGCPRPEAAARAIQQAQARWNLPESWLGASAQAL